MAKLYDFQWQRETPKLLLAGAVFDKYDEVSVFCLMAFHTLKIFKDFKIRGKFACEISSFCDTKFVISYEINLY